MDSAAMSPGDVNDYLREMSGRDVTAKDFRTWAGTVLAAHALKSAHGAAKQKPTNAGVKQAVDFVAGKLGNTPAVCRKCYIHPALFDGFKTGKLFSNGSAKPSAVNGAGHSTLGSTPSLRRDERAVLKFLRCCRREESRMRKSLVT